MLRFLVSASTRRSLHGASSPAPSRQRRPGIGLEAGADGARWLAGGPRLPRPASLDLHHQRPARERPDEHEDAEAGDAAQAVVVSSRASPRTSLTMETAATSVHRTMVPAQAFTRSAPRDRRRADGG